MPTVEEMRKALAYKQLEDSSKKLAYCIHKNNVKIAETVKIPYRIVKENSNINIYYPANHRTIKDFWEWRREAHKELDSIFEEFGSRLEYMYLPTGIFKLTEQGQALHEEYEASQRAFKNEQERQYYFAQFLQGYDIASFSMFDCYGSKNTHTQAEYEQFKKELLELQADFEQHKEKYFTDYVPRYTASEEKEQGAEV